MPRKHGRGRGISVGTIVMVAFSLILLLVGGVIFTRISGDIDQISIDPKLLTEPLNVLSRSISDTTPQGGAGQVPDAGNPTPEQAAAVAATPAPTPTPEPTLPPIRSFTLTAVGQVSAGSDLRASGRDSNGDYNYTPSFASVSAAMAGDLSIATLRTTLSDEDSDFDGACAPYNLAVGLGGAGVNLMNLSTDRLLDHGTQGIGKTLDILQQLSLSSTGAFRNEQERNTVPMLDINGVKVGVLSYTNSISAAGKSAANEAEIATATRILDAQAAATDISALRGAGAEIVVVLAQWGARGDAKPSAATREMADALAGAGADIILGTGPTTVHELERRTVTDTSGTAREVLIVYSLGNFLVDDSRETSDITGVILHTSITWDAQAGKASYADTWYMPTWIMRWKDGNTNRYRLEPAGIGTKPENMTDSIYSNMKKAYDNMAAKLGNTATQPKAAP